MGDYLAPGRVHTGDARELAGRLEPGSVQTIITSPPYYALRDYGTGTWAGGDAACDHQGPPKRTQAGFNERYFGTPPGTDKQGDLRTPYAATCARCGATRVDRQLGLEATPAAYVANLVAVFAALRPALKDDGTIWVNLGDSYNNFRTQMGPGQLVHGRENLHGKPEPESRGRGTPGYPEKCLLGMPWRVALALVDDGWILRSDIIWHKPNPMPESVTDRPTRSHEYLFLLSKRPAYYFDATAIAEDVSREMRTVPWAVRAAAGAGSGSALNGHNASQAPGLHDLGGHGGKRNRRTVWSVPSAPTSIDHFATYPRALIRPCVLAGTSEAGECAACGTAWGRVTERGAAGVRNTHAGSNGQQVHRPGVSHTLAALPATTTGWAPRCSCPPGTPTRPQVVLDPFVGSGTTAFVAAQEGRRWIGFDLDERAVGWTRDRLAALPVGRLPGL
jgi:DNA modification methylase